MKDQTYGELRRALITGRFEPGEQVTVKALAEQLGSGVMPVREAVQRLVAEGALVSLPTGRVYVPSYTAEEFREIIDIRALLEPFAARRAAERATGALAEELRRLADGLSAASIAHDDPEVTLWANYRFHFTLYEAAGSRHLYDLIEAVWLRFGPMIIHTFREEMGRGDYVRRELALNDAICDAVARKDGDAASAALSQIIETTAGWYADSFPFTPAG